MMNKMYHHTVRQQSKWKGVSVEGAADGRTQNTVNSHTTLFLRTQIIYDTTSSPVHPTSINPTPHNRNISYIII